MHHIILAYTKAELDQDFNPKEKRNFLKKLSDPNMLQMQDLLEKEVVTEIENQKNQAKKQSKLNKEEQIRIQRRFSFDSLEGRWHALLEQDSGESDVLFMLTTKEIDDKSIYQILEQISKNTKINKTDPDLKPFEIEIKKNLFYKTLNSGTILLMLIVIGVLIYMFTQGDLI